MQLSHISTDNQRPRRLSQPTHHLQTFCRKPYFCCQTAEAEKVAKWLWIHEVCAGARYGMSRFAAVQYPGYELI